MTEPITVNRSFIVPNTSDLPGAWGTSALNPNFQSIDTLVGGVTTLSLSSATTVLLSVPATTGVWPGGNPSQSMNALIRFTGAQTGSATIQFTLPGYYIVENQCTGTTSVRLQPSNLTGNCVGAPPGKKCHVFFDGTHMDYVNMPDPGTAYDLHTNTTTLPPWMTVCTVSPYLLKDGTVYTASVYPALAQLLGSTYGGNGVTTFGVPDERSRFRLGVDTGSTGRVTQAGSSMTGTLLGQTGGGQFQNLSLTQLPTGITVAGSVSISGGNQIPVASNSQTSFNAVLSGGSIDIPVIIGAGAWSYTTVMSGSMTSNNTLGGSHPIMPPTSISFVPLIKT